MSAAPAAIAAEAKKPELPKTEAPSGSRLIVGPNVKLKGAEIHGTFEGELTARSQLLIHATGRVSEKIRYGKILIDEGGELSGEIKVLADSESAPEKPRNEPVPTLTTVAG